MSLTRYLTAEGEYALAEFEARYGTDGNCSCHLSPPCGSCTHPGNPRNLAEDPSVWIDPYEKVKEVGSW